MRDSPKIGSGSQSEHSSTDARTTCRRGGALSCGLVDKWTHFRKWPSAEPASDAKCGWHALGAVNPVGSVVDRQTTADFGVRVGVLPPTESNGVLPVSIRPPSLLEPSRPGEEPDAATSMSRTAVAELN